MQSLRQYSINTISLSDYICESFMEEDESIAKLLGDKAVIRFTRFQLGEGIEKKKEDFAEEVRKQAGL